MVDRRSIESDMVVVPRHGEVRISVVPVAAPQDGRDVAGRIGQGEVATAQLPGGQMPRTAAEPFGHGPAHQGNGWAAGRPPTGGVGRHSPGRDRRRRFTAEVVEQGHEHQAGRRESGGPCGAERGADLTGRRSVQDHDIAGDRFARGPGRRIVQVPGRDDRRPVECDPGAGQREDVSAELERGAVDRQGEGWVGLEPEERNDLKIGPVVAGRFQAETAKLRGDVLGGLVVAQRSRCSSPHRIMGQSVEPGLEVGGRNRSLGLGGQRGGEDEGQEG